MRVESFRDGDGTVVPPGSGPWVQAGRLTTTTGRSGSQQEWGTKVPISPCRDPSPVSASSATGPSQSLFCLPGGA